MWNWMYGDVNWDGRIDTTDALCCLQFSVYSMPLYDLNPHSEHHFLYEMTLEQKPWLVVLDVDLGYRIDAGDALMILRHSLERIDRFLAEATPVPPHE